MSGLSPDRGGAHPDRGADLLLVHEANDRGGSERVLAALAERYPDARIVCNHFDELEGGPPWKAALERRVEPVPSGRRKWHFLAPLYARRLARTPAGRPRLVLTLSGSGWGLAAPTPPEVPLLCYSCGPPRHLYRHTGGYLRRLPAGLRPLVRAALPALRAYDRRLMGRPDRIVANSAATASAIARVYGRPADVVHPPVRTEFFTPAAVERRHFLAVARLVPQKSLDPLVEAFHGLSDRLVVVGQGPWLDRLRGAAPANVRFAGAVGDESLRDLYRTSRALICPSVEEFGIVMAEAHACGTPVIGPRAGGALEIVDDPATGVQLERVDAEAIAGAVRAAADGSRFDAAACRASAERFSTARFIARIEAIVAEELAAARAVPSRPESIPDRGSPSPARV